MDKPKYDGPPLAELLAGGFTKYGVLNPDPRLTAAEREGLIAVTPWEAIPIVNRLAASDTAREGDVRECRNLVALLNGDGGHRQDAIGLDAAAREGMERVNVLWRENDQLRAEVERLTAQLRERLNKVQTHGTRNQEEENRMPAKSAKQRRFMGADLARAKAGKKTRTGMSTQQLREFASTPGTGGGGGKKKKRG